MKIKAITLWEPWATLVSLEEKRYETRSWSTDYRGLLAIHAAKRPARESEVSNWMKGTLERHGFDRLDRLQYGKVVCIVWLVDVVPTEEVVAMGATDPRIRNDELEFGDYSPGRFAWQLDMVCRAGVPARGKQGFWNWTPPPDLVRLFKEGTYS